ncbi:MAG: hypothetical protein C0602_02155 [Denitrovibrio sp.]|nr:MAG: hypothetical protein C0602_02155 [Denitrovibrio sp.]
MSKLGATLKNKRETLGLDMDKVTEETRISADIIEVLEKGEYKSMPSYNHAKNFVKNYASYLKLDLDKVKELFDQECVKEDFYREVKYVTAPVTKEKTVAPSGIRFLIPIIILAVVIFTGYKVYTAMQKGKEMGSVDSAVVKEETKSAIDKELDTPVDEQEVKEVIETIKKEAVSPEPEKVQKKEAVKVPEKSPETVEVTDEEALSAFLPDVKEEPKAAAKTAVVNFSDVCWVHIVIDGKKEMDFIAEKGNQRDVVFHYNFIMDIGNAAVVSVSYGNRTIAGLGAYKEPVKGLKFTVNDNDRLSYTSVK